LKNADVDQDRNRRSGRSGRKLGLRGEFRDTISKVSFRVSVRIKVDEGADQMSFDRERGNC
jgi:hypothetical protein